jgi:hypothetical protein
MRKYFIGFNLLVFLMVAIQVHADSGLDTIKSRINQALVVLKDPALKSDSAKELKKRLRAILIIRLIMSSFRGAPCPGTGTS